MSRENREFALTDVADYIDMFYNRARRHSHLGGVSPEQFEAVQTPRRRSVHQILGTPISVVSYS